MDKNIRPDLKKHLSQSAWLNALPPALRDMLLARSTRLRLVRDELLYDFGDPAGGLYGVYEGAVAIRVDDSDSGTIFGHLLGSGTWFGEISAMTRGPRTIGVSVQSRECSFLAVSLADLDRITAAHPDFWRYLGLLTAMHAATSLQTARDLLIRDPRERVWSVLSRLDQSVGKWGPIPLTQEELADMCGLSRGAVARALAGFEASGQLRRGFREITVLRG